MSDTLSLDELKSMLAAGEGPCVSLFMPTHAAAPENRADPLQLKSLLREARSLLEARGVAPSAADALLAPAAKLPGDGLFWRPRPGGLAVYLSASGMRTFRTSDPLAPAVFVNDRFQVRPILADVDRGERFFALALSQHLVRMFRGNREGLTEIDLGDMPKDIAEALRNDGFDEQLQMHSSGNAPVGRAHGAAVFHGSGADTGITTRYLTEYVKRVSAGLQDLVHDRRSPLVIAAVAELAALYRESDRTHALASGVVTGNPETLTFTELHGKAWAIASAEFEAERRGSLDRYREAVGTAHGASGPEQVVPAAAQGRVDTLLIDPTASFWGTFHADDGSVDVHPEQGRNDDDLVDLAAAHTILNGGAVFAAADLGEPLAAILRY